MPKWNVKVKVRVDEVLEFERVIEAEDKAKAEYAAEETIGEEDVFEKLKECDAVARASFDAEAEQQQES